MTELGPDARSILEAAQGGDDPDARERERVRTAVLRRIGVGAAVVSASVASTAAAKGAVASTSLLVKLAILAGALTLATAGGVLAYRNVQRRHAAVEKGPSETPVATVVPPSPTVVTLPSAAPPLASEVVVASPAPLASTSVVASVHPEPKGVATIAPSAKPDTLQDELALLGVAMAALGENDGERALALLDEHAKKFPDGTLAEERNGARCIALCLLGRPDARSHAESFLAAHPAAPLRARIEKACGLP